VLNRTSRAVYNLTSVYRYFRLVANSASDIQYGWRLGNNKSVNFDTKVLLSQFDLIRYPQYDETTDMQGRMLFSISSYVCVCVRAPMCQKLCACIRCHDYDMPQENRSDIAIDGCL
jgi:hypothetical protein